MLQFRAGEYNNNRKILSQNQLCITELLELFCAHGISHGITLYFLNSHIFTLEYMLFPVHLSSFVESYCNQLIEVFILHGPEQGFYAKPSCTFGGGHPAIWSWPFGVGHLAIAGHLEQDTRLYGKGHLEQDNQLYGERPTDTIEVKCMLLFEAEHLRQLCLILDSGEKLKHVY